MKTAKIIIEGPERQIYNILKENKLRFKRYGMNVEGDTDIERPKTWQAKEDAKKKLKELREEAKELKIRGYNIMGADKLKAKIKEAKGKKEDKGAAGRKTKEEKTKLKNK